MKTKKVLSVLFASLFLVAAGFVSCSQEVSISPVASNKVTYCSIEFGANGGTLSFTSTQVVLGQCLKDFPNATKDGYSLIGWYYNLNGVEKKFDENTVVTDSMYVYAKWGTPITPGTTSVQSVSMNTTTVYVESGSTFELRASYTPADARINAGYGNTSSYRYYSVGSITAVDGTISKSFYAKLPGTYSSTYLYDAYTGKSSGYANVTVTGPALETIPELTVSGSKAETESEYTKYDFSSNNYVTFYKVQLEAGTTYNFQVAHNGNIISGSPYCYWALYDSSYEKKFGETSNSSYAYTPGADGTYILGVCSSSNNSGSVGVNVYAAISVQTLTLNPSSYTVESGETFAITANYTPANADINPSYNSYSNSRYYPVGNTTAAEGVMSKSFYAKLPGTYSSTIFSDNISGKTTAGASVTVTGPAVAGLPELALSTTRAESASDFTQYTFSSNNYVTFYKLHLEAGTTYNFQVAHNGNIISGSPYCYWALYNSSYVNLLGESSNSTGAYTPTADGTYVLGLCAYYNGTGTIGVNVYSINKITDFTVSSTVNMTIGDTVTENITLTPSTGVETNFSISNSNKDLFAQVIGNQLTVNCGFPGTKTITLRDSISGISKNITVNVAGDSSVVQEIPVYATESSDPDEYTVVSLSDSNPSQLLKVYFEAGRTYTVQCADSDNSQGTGLSVNDCYFYLYDSGFNFYTSHDSGTFSYNCTVDGYYYVGIRRYSNSDNRKGAVHVYAPKVIESITLNPSSYTVESGETFAITADYTPADGSVNPGYGNYSSSRYYPVGNTTAAEGVMSKSFYAKLPGTYSSTYLYDDMTGKSTAGASVTVTGPSVAGLPELAVRSTMAESASDFTRYTFSDNNFVTFYKVELVAGTPYTFQVAHNGNFISGSPYCNWALYDSSYEKKFGDIDSSSRVYTPTADGTYILGLCSYYNGNGTIGMSVYAPKRVRNLTLNPSSYTVESGETFAITADYIPADAPVTPGYDNYSSSAYYPVGDITAADGVMSKSFYAKLPGTYTSTNLYDNMTGKATAGASVTVTGPAVAGLPELAVGTARAETASDFTQYSFSASSYVTFYKVELEAGTTYNFQVAHDGNIISNSPTSKWALYDSSYENLSGVISYSSFAYTPEADGTYVLGLCSDDNTSGTIGVNVYIATELLDFTISVDMTAGVPFTGNIILTPPTVGTNFSISNSNNDLVAQVIGNQLTVNCGFPGTKTITLTDSISGISKTITVNVAGDSSVVQEIPVYTSVSSDPNEYTVLTLSDSNPSQLLKVYFEAGKRYTVQCADSDNSQGTGLSLNDCYFYLYNSSFSQINSSDSGTISYNCTVPGYYYVGIRRYSNDSNRNGAVHVFTVVPIESLTLNPSSYTVESGETFAITADYTPADASVDPNYSNYSSSRYSPVGVITAADGVMSKSFYAKLPGTYTSTYLYDNISGKTTASASVTVTGPSVAGLPELAVISTMAESASDFTQYTFSSNNYVTFYKLQLEAGTPYTFQVAHDGNFISGSPYCNWALYDSSYENLSGVISNNYFAYTPEADGTYILGLCSSDNYTGTIGVNVCTVNIITDFTVSSTVNMTIGDIVTENITLTPSTGVETNFSISNSNNDLFAQVIDNQLTINCGFPGTKTITLTDSISGISKNITVNVAGDSSVVSETLTVGSSSSSTASDYTEVTLSDSNPSQLLKVYFEAGKTYTVQCADSDTNQGTGLSLNDCYFYLYDSGFNFYTREDSGTFSYNCTVDGYYYVGIRRYSNSGNVKGAVHVYTTD